MMTRRKHVYGMPYADWKTKYQTDATPEQMAKFKDLTLMSDNALEMSDER